MVNKKKLLERITAAKLEILEAEKELDRLVCDIKIAPRSEKTVITKIIEEAFARVKTARTFLIELEDLVGTSED